ncbi:MAG: 50S ribosome-binding GTPase, partial [Bacillales bacterium]|nr:50S ribosome-binding GTPase [Bacillales bacterium]
VLTKRIKAKNRGIKSIIIRCLVVGIPNVGKSTFINKVVNKSLAKTANIPGFTKSITIYKLNDEIEIVDTPGLLYSKFTDRLVGLRLALIGSIKEDILPINEVFDYYLEIMKKYSANFLKKYNVEPDNPQLISIIGNNKGLLFKEGLVDEQTTKKVLIKEFQKGLVGRISLE